MALTGFQSDRINCKFCRKSPYSSRAERSRFAYAEYKRYFGDSVLDVGGFQGALGWIFPGRYVNIDIDSNADYVLDFDKLGTLPFNDMMFDTVVCTDTLEHLENIHFILDEIYRVAKKTVIISMPNPWINIWYIVGGLKSQFSKRRFRCLPDRHWTLPTEKPTDRHRWFYSLSEADEIIRYRGRKVGFEVREYNPHVIIKSGFSLDSILRIVHQKFWSRQDFVNLYAWVGWWVLSREQR